MTRGGERNTIAQLKSVRLVSKLPVVESTYQYASSVYTKVKNLNRLTRWGLDSIEGGVYLVVDTSLTFVPLVRAPLSLVDDILYKGLEQVELRVPAVTYPPELLVSMTKDYFSAKVIRPVLRRADSVKQIGLNGATKYGELAVTRLDNALDIADRYVDKYLPDAADTVDKDENHSGAENKRVKTIEHVNRLSRKLQRRLTKRTIAEAKALRQQSIDTMQCLLYLADMMVKDPVLFAEKMKTVWLNLSEDEPENQVPPANLEQLIAMLVREMSRKAVHFTNFTVIQVSKLPTFTVHVVQMSVHQLNYLVDQLLKIVRLDGVKNYAVSTGVRQYNQMKLTVLELQKLILQLLDSIRSQGNGDYRMNSTALEPVLLHLSKCSESDRGTKAENQPSPPSQGDPIKETQNTGNDENYNDSGSTKEKQY